MPTPQNDRLSWLSTLDSAKKRACKTCPDLRTCVSLVLLWKYFNSAPGHEDM
jgi:hypothetical protein